MNAKLKVLDQGSPDREISHIIDHFKGRQIPLNNQKDFVMMQNEMIQQNLLKSGKV